MNTTVTRSTLLSSPHGEASAHLCRLRFRTLEMPNIKDGIVIGRDAPVSPEAMLETFRLTSSQRFLPVPVTDNIIRSILIRDGLIKRLALQVIADIILGRVKPFMSPSEVLQLDLDVDTLLESAI